jgi:hypothetical protein
METCCLMLGQKRTAQFQPSKWSFYRRSAHGASKMEPRSTALTPGLAQKERLPRECAFVLQGQTPRLAQYCWASRDWGDYYQAAIPETAKSSWLAVPIHLPGPNRGSDMRINLPSTLPGDYAYVLKIAGPIL